MTVATHSLSQLDYSIQFSSPYTGPKFGWFDRLFFAIGIGITLLSFIGSFTQPYLWIATIVWGTVVWVSVKIAQKSLKAKTYKYQYVWERLWSNDPEYLNVKRFLLLAGVKTPLVDQIVNTMIPEAVVTNENKSIEGAYLFTTPTGEQHPGVLRVIVEPHNKRNNLTILVNMLLPV